MSNITIPNLPSAIALTGSEQLLAVQSGSSVKITAFQLATYTLSVQNNVVSTIGFGSTGLTPSAGTSGNIIVSGVLNVANGGTGVTTSTGTGSVVLNTSPTLVTPALGTPSSGVMTNVTGLPLTTGVTGILPSANGGTGFGTYTTGDLVYASATNTLSKLAIGPNGYVLGSNGTTVSWQLAGTGTVTSVSQTFTGGLISVAGSPVTSSGTLALTVAGTSGGIPYFSSSSAWASSAALAANAIVVGGGAGAAPSTVTTNSTVLTALGNGPTGTGNIVLSTAPTFTTSITSPLVLGGTGTGSTLTLQSTSGIGSTDSVVIKVGNNGATTALTVASSGTVTIGTLNLTNALGTSYGGTGLTSFSAANNAIYSTSSAALTAGTLPILAGGTGITSFGTGVQTALGQNVTGSGGIVLSTSPTLTTPTTSGNVTATGTSARFLADFSNTTVNSRFAFQTSTTNGATGIYALPNGTSVAASLQASNAADPTNASKILIATNGSTDVQLVSGINGTGTYLPMTFWNNGSEQMRLAVSGNFGIGTNNPAVKLAISSTDSILIPVGTTAQRPTGATGYFRFNSDTSAFEGYNGSAWGSIGGGATGGGSDQIFYLNGQTVATSYSIPSGQNAGTFGPISVNAGVTVTIPAGSTWSII